MARLTKTFTTSSRDEILDICDQISKIISEQIGNGTTKKPIVIGIQGNKNSGKSIFWDRIREQILGQSGIYLAAQSESTDSDDTLGYIREKITRRFESWVGSLFNTDQKIRLYFANMDLLFSGYKMEHMPLILQSEKAFEGDAHALKELGDVIILTNSDNSRAHEVPFDITVDLQYQNPDHDYWNEDKREWKMNISITSTIPDVCI